jgi:hypothetical protein
MILLFNVKITSQGLSYYHRSEWLPVYDRMDIFKYCLSSYSVLDPLITKYLFFIQVEPEFQHRKLELEAWINGLFPQDKTSLNWYRNDYTRQWRELCLQFDDRDLIWFAGNDDHIFIDSSLDVVRAGIKLLNEDPDPYSVIYYSHWPEQMRLSMHHNGELTADANYIKFTWRTFDAIRIMKAERFKRYWQDNDFGDTVIFRTDTLWHSGYHLTAPVYSPTKELVRHYDGYSHVSPHIINVAPPLFIPPGFFDNDLHIRIGYTERDDEWTNFNPASQFLYAAQPHGTDYRWHAVDIPLFWQKHLAEIDYSPDYDAELMREARNAAFLAATRIPMHCYSTDFDHTGATPAEWFRNHLLT